MTSRSMRRFGASKASDLQARVPKILSACTPLLGTAILLLYAFSLPAGAADKDAWRAVTGDALSLLFRDSEFGDGVHFAYQFRRDGSFTGTEMSKTVSGSWRTRKDEFCWS